MAAFLPTVSRTQVVPVPHTQPLALFTHTHTHTHTHTAHNEYKVCKLINELILLYFYSPVFGDDFGHEKSCPPLSL